MDEQGYQTIRAFDSTFTSNRIQMMKILFSHLAPDKQGAFAVYIKLMELQYVFSLLRNPRGIHFPGKTRLSSDFFSGENEGTIELLDELLPFSGPAERKRIEDMKNMMQSMKQMRDMMDMIQMMQEMFPEGMGGDGATNPMDMLSGLGGMGGMGNISGMPNLSDLFGMFGTGSSDEAQKSSH